MWKRFGVVLLWVLATVGTASITLAAVGQVGDHVTQRAAIPIDSADLLSSPAVQALASTTTTTTTTPVATSRPGEDTTTTAPVEGTTTTIGSGSTTPATTAQSTTTTTAASTTTAAPSTLDTRCGSIACVTVSFDGTSVRYQTATKTYAGGGVWTVEVKDYGPSQVEVEFEAPNDEMQYHAEVVNGELVVTIQEHHEN